MGNKRLVRCYLINLNMPTRRISVYLDSIFFLLQNQELMVDIVNLIVISIIEINDRNVIRMFLFKFMFVVIFSNNMDLIF